MSEKDSASKLKAQQGGSQSTGRKSSGSTRYRMAAAQAQQDVAKSAQDLDDKARTEEKAQRKASATANKLPAAKDGQAQPPDGSEDNVRGLWKSRVLASYKGRNPRDSHTLLAKITHQGKAALQVSEHYKTSALQEMMIAKVDHMFDAFQNCAYEFNKFAQGSELELNWIRPFISKEGTANWHSSDNNLMVVFSGRMSTRRWTMVVKGTLEYVQVFILPADKLIGFALSHENFKPYFQMEPYSEGLDVNWRIDETDLNEEMFTIINRELFNALIRHAKEEAYENENFDLRMCGILPPEPEEDPQADIKRQKYYQEAFFEDIKNTMDGKFESKPISTRLEEMAKFSRAPAPVPAQVDEFTQPVPAHIKAELDVLQAAAAPAPNPAPTQAPNSPPNAVPGGQTSQSNHINQLHNIMHQRVGNTGRTSMNRTPSTPGEPDFNSDDWKQVPEGDPEKSRLDPEQQRHIMKMADQAGLTDRQESHAEPMQPNKAGVLPNVPSQPMMRRSSPPATPQASYPQPLPHQQPPPHPEPQPQSRGHEPDFGNEPVYPSAQSPQAPSPNQNPNPNVRPQAVNNQPPMMNLPSALTQLIQSLDRELEVVAKAGADAFAARDLARADAALKFSGRLNEYRQMSQELLDYYRRKR